MRPDFGKKFFEKHQRELVSFANSWIGRRFFDFWGAFRIPSSFEIIEIHPNCIVGNRTETKGEIIETAIFSTDNHYQKKIEKVFDLVTKLVPIALTSRFLEPTTVLGQILPLIALTTGTYYPASGSGGGSVDGYVGFVSGSDTWSNRRNATSGGTNNTTGEFAYVQVGHPAEPEGQWSIWVRGITTFDTSAIGSGKVVSSATLSLYGDATGTSDQFDAKIGIIDLSLADTDSIANGDFDGTTFTRQCNTDIDIGSWATGSYNDFVLNTSGINSIQMQGVTQFMQALNIDIDNSEPAWVFATKHAWVTFTTADYGSNKPKLSVTYSVAPYTITSSETATLTETLTKTSRYPRTNSETHTLTDTVTRTARYPMTRTETITGTETMTKIFTGLRVITENVTLSDSLIRTINRIVTILETATISENIVKTVSYLVNKSETETVTEQVEKSLTRLLILLETVSLTETVSRTVTSVFDYLDGTTIAENMTRLVLASRTGSEELTVEDADLVERVTLFIKNFTETVSINELASQTFRRFLISLSEKGYITDHYGEFPIDVDDSLSESDSHSRTYSANRTFLSVPTITETVSTESIFIRIVTSLFSLSDTLTKTATFYRTATEEQLLEDLVTRVWSINRIFSSNLTLDDVRRVGLRLVQTFDETVTITESMSKTLTWARTILDDNPIVDSYERTVTWLKEILSTPVLTENDARPATTYPRSGDEGYTLTEAFSRPTHLIPVIVSEVISLIDSFAKTVSYAARTVNESLGITDTLSKGKVYLRTLTESYTLTEGFYRPSHYIYVILSEMLSVTETVVVTVSYVIYLLATELFSITERTGFPLNWTKRTKPTTTWTPRKRP